MTVQRPSPIQLTSDEQSLLKEISFEPGRGHDALVRSCLAAKPLMLSLIKRGALPEIRRMYLTDAGCNVGSKRSRMQVFEDNGTTGEAIFGHGTFLKYLKYVVYGPNLPIQTIEGFCELIEDDDDRQRARAYARAQVRTHGLDRRLAGDEFYKLALECGLDEPFARSVREAAMSTKSSK
jgi:hypothetical protein